MTLSAWGTTVKVWVNRCQSRVPVTWAKSSKANSDPSALKIRFLNAEISVVSPSDNLTIERPNAATLTITDKDGNGVVIDASAKKPYVTETVGHVNRLDGNTFDLGEADGIDLLIIKG